MAPLDPSKTLQVDDSTFLTLGDKSLHIIDNDPASRRKIKRSRCCGLLSKQEPGPSQIDLYNILNAIITEKGLTITYMDSTTPQNAFLNALQYPINPSKTSEAQTWASTLNAHAYGSAKPNKTLKILINPFCSGAMEKFHKIASPILSAANCTLSVEETQYRGHASEIAQSLDLIYDGIVCCSGDGLPHEVFNGLARRKDAQDALGSVAVSMIPCGSGNAMAWNLFGSDDVAVAALAIVKGVNMPLDLMSVTQGDRHTVSFLSQSLGVLADSDLKTEHLRWMGDQRFIYGVFATIVRKTAYPCLLAVKTLPEQGEEISSGHWQVHGGLSLPLKYGTVEDRVREDWEVMPREQLASFYTGKMKIVAKDTNFFPDAEPNDGLLDLMVVDDTIGWVGALEAIVRLPQGRYRGLKDVQMRKVAAYRLTPLDSEGCISVDGERYPFEALQVEVHRGLGRVLARSEREYQAPNV